MKTTPKRATPKRKATSNRSRLEAQLRAMGRKLGIDVSDAIKAGREAAKAVNGYRRGRKLTVGQLKSLPDGTWVWMTYQKGDEKSFRINEPYAITRKPDEVRPEGTRELVWDLETKDDGAEFRQFMDARSVDTEECYDDACGTGESYLYEAIKVVKVKR
jgi:hypothetical protein